MSLAAPALVDLKRTCLWAHDADKGLAMFQFLEQEGDVLC
jgi:hypothetical protein